MSRFIWLPLFALAAGCGGGRPAPPAEEVAASALYDAYEKNAVAADEKYKDRPLRVTGIAKTVYADGVVLAGATMQGHDLYGVDCRWARGKAPAGVERGRRLTVRGVCRGVPSATSGVVLDGCAPVP